MNFTEIRTDIMDRLGVTSAAAEARIGRAINRWHRRITASLGLNITRNTDTTESTTVGERDVTFSSVEKVMSVWIPDSGSDKPLEEITPAQMRDLAVGTGGWPRRYAIIGATANTVTIRFDRTAESEYDVHANVYPTLAAISGVDEPTFAESFHDAIEEAVMAEEYRKMEKLKEAKVAKDEHDAIMSNLRYFIAKSNMLKIQQGGNPRPWQRLR